MGIGESVMNMFKTAPNPGVTNTPGDRNAVQQQEQGKQGAAGTGNPNPQLDVGAANQADKDKKPASPLDQFKDLWNTPDSEESKDGNKDKPGATQEQTPEHPYSQKKLVDAAKKMDFSRNISPEILAKAFPGGDGEAIKNILNHIGRQAFASGGHLAVQISQGEVGGFSSKFEADLPSKLRAHSVSSAEYSNPAYKHPAMKPFVDLTRQQIAQKYPDATVGAIEQMTQEYIQGMMEEVNGQNPAKKQQQQKQEKDVKSAQMRGDFDWSEHFESP